MADVNNPKPDLDSFAEWGYPGEVMVVDQMPLYGGGDHSGPAQPNIGEQMKDSRTHQFLEGQEFTSAGSDLPR